MPDEISGLGGAVVGAGEAAAVTLAAPATVSGLTALGLSPTVASATVTGGLFLGGTYGVYRGVVNTAQSAGTASVTGDMAPLAFDLSSFAGGSAIGTTPIFNGLSGGRYMADSMGILAGNGPSPAPMMDFGNVLSYELSNSYDPLYPNGSDLAWLASAPTPFSGGFVATGIASGVATGTANIMTSLSH